MAGEVGKQAGTLHMILYFVSWGQLIEANQSLLLQENFKKKSTKAQAVDILEVELLVATK